MFTSGTTGRPKAARIPAASLWASLRGLARGSGLPDDGRPPRIPMRAARPVFLHIAHMGGLLGTLTGFHLGVPVLLCPKWSSDLAFDVLGRYRVSSLGLTPAMVYDLVTAPGERTLGSVRTVSVGTAALPEATRVAFEDRYGVPVMRNYGQTEFAGAIAFERYDDVVAGRRPTGSVGRIAPGVEVRIVDADGAALPPGEVGEIVARSPSAMAGYLGSESAADGWIATGDLGFLHDGDMLTIVGRTRDMVICGGFNIYPSQVEQALNELPHVLDSAVAGVPDDRLGEVPVALVVTDGADVDLDEVRARAASAARRPTSCPDGSTSSTAIPRTENGKVDRPARRRPLRGGTGMTDDELPHRAACVAGRQPAAGPRRPHRASSSAGGNAPCTTPDGPGSPGPASSGAEGRHPASSSSSTRSTSAPGATS